MMGAAENAFVEDSDVRRLLRDSAGQFLAREHSTRRLRELLGSGRDFDPALWGKMADQGWLGLRFSEQDGGLGLDCSDAAVLAELFGRALLPAPFIELAYMPAALLSSLSGQAGVAALTRDIATAGTLVSVAWQDSSDRIDTSSSRTILHAVQGGYQLNGAKVRVPYIADLRKLLVTAKLGNQLALVLVDATVPSVTISPEAALDGSRTAHVTFADAMIREQDVVACGPESETALSLMVDETLLVLAARLYGIATKAVALASDYMLHRVQFGKTLSSFQVLRHRIVDLTIETELARAALGAGFKALTAGCPTERRAKCGIAKALAADAAQRATRSAVQIFGAIGYTDEIDIGLYLKAAGADGARLGVSSYHRRALSAWLGATR